MENATTLTKLINILRRITEKIKRANNIQHSGGHVSKEDWAELYQLQNEAGSVLSDVE